MTLWGGVSGGGRGGGAGGGGGGGPGGPGGGGGGGGGGGRQCQYSWGQPHVDQLLYCTAVEEEGKITAVVEREGLLLGLSFAHRKAPVGGWWVV